MTGQVGLLSNGFGKLIAVEYDFTNFDLLGFANRYRSASTRWESEISSSEMIEMLPSVYRENSNVCRAFLSSLRSVRY